MTTPPRRTSRKTAHRSGGQTGNAYETIHQAALECLPDAFLAIDEQGCVATCNPRAAQLFGWSPGEMPGRPLAELLPQAGALTDADDGQRQRLAARRRNGDTFIAEVRRAAVTVGTAHYTALFVIDIDDTLIAEQQLVQAQKLEAIGHLTGGLAHDFNNILGIIIGSLDLVSPNIVDKMDRELVAAALSAAHRGADITRALLAVARRRALKPQPTNVNELIDELAPLLRQTAGKRVELSLSANAIDAVCNIDAGGLNNALVNLVINARDAMPDGGQIVIYAYTTDILPHALTAPMELKPGRYIVIGVDDNGTGMPPEVAMKAFDPFFTTKDRGRGTGLGLAMVYGFARQSGGTARIESAPGRGTSVQLIIPAMLHAAGTESSVRPATAPRGHARILFVDDEAPLLRIAGEWLRGLGYRVSTALSAEDALNQLAEHHFDLLVTDIVMTGAMDGLSLVERCQRLYPEMPALVATGFADGQAASLRTRAPVLDKPYTRTTLGNAVAEALAGTGDASTQVESAAGAVRRPRIPRKKKDSTPATKRRKSA